MKHSIMLVLAFVLCFTPASGQTLANATPWDAAFEIPKGETRTIKGEKGKITVVTFWRSSLAESSVVRTAKMSINKKDSKTHQKLETCQVGK